MRDPNASPVNAGISGPGFVSLLVRDLAVAADFYEHTIGLKRDPQPFQGAIAFLSTPIPFAVRAAPSDVPRDSQPTPGAGIALWFKAADGQAAHDVISQAGITILKPPFDGPFGRTFIFADPDGYRITVYEQDTPIIERLPPTQ